MARPPREGARRLGRDFWLYFSGQSVSQLGSSFTAFALPLLVFKLTHSATNLAITTAAEFVPYLLFGLVLGAVVDRVDRRKMMLRTDLARAGVIAVLPVLSLFGVLEVWQIYVVTFVQSTLGILFICGEFAAIPALVGEDELVTANARIMATNNVGPILGPTVAGALVAFVPVAQLLFFDAGYVPGLRWLPHGHPAQLQRGDEAGREGGGVAGPQPARRRPGGARLRLAPPGAAVDLDHDGADQLRLLDRERAAGAVRRAGAERVELRGGVPVRLRRRRYRGGEPGGGADPPAPVVCGHRTRCDRRLRARADGHGAGPCYPAALVLWGASSGFGLLLNINTGALRQAIVPPQLFGRVVSVAQVLAWSAIPLGAIAGAAAINASSVTTVYAAIGVLIVAIALAFALSPVGKGDRYLAEAAERRAEQAAATGSVPS